MEPHSPTPTRSGAAPQCGSNGSETPTVLRSYALCRLGPFSSYLAISPAAPLGVFGRGNTTRAWARLYHLTFVVSYCQGNCGRQCGRTQFHVSTHGAAPARKSRCHKMFFGPTQGAASAGHRLGSEGNGSGAFFPFGRMSHVGRECRRECGAGGGGTSRGFWRRKRQIAFFRCISGSAPMMQSGPMWVGPRENAVQRFPAPVWRGNYCLLDHWWVPL